MLTLLTVLTQTLASRFTIARADILPKSRFPPWWWSGSKSDNFCNYRMAILLTTSRNQRTLRKD
jgi:hypothetical protein